MRSAAFFGRADKRVSCFHAAKGGECLASSQILSQFVQEFVIIYIYFVCTTYKYSAFRLFRRPLSRLKTVRSSKCSSRPPDLLSQPRAVGGQAHCLPRSKNKATAPFCKAFSHLQNGAVAFFFGALEGTRTPDLLVRSQTLYPAELPARMEQTPTHSLLTAQVSYHIFAENATPKFNFFARFLLFFILQRRPSGKM